MNIDRAINLLSHLNIKDRDSGLIVPFKPNHNQNIFFDSIKRQYSEVGMIRAIVLKARRVGISSASDGLLLPHALARPQAHAKIVAHRADTAEGLFRVPRDFARDLPFIIGEILVRKITIHHPRGHSIIDIATAGSVSGGRGLTLSALHLSEAAQFGGDDSFLALLPAVQSGPGSMVFIESTAFGRVGIGAAFYEFWKNSVSGKTGYIPIFLSWLDDPGCIRDPEEAADAPATDEEKMLMAKPFHATKAQVAWFRYTLESQCQGLMPKFFQEYPHCVTSDTYISTDKGIVPIITAMDVGAKLTESGPITAWAPQQPSRIYKLTTKDGRALRGNADHPIAVPDGFIRLADLKEGQEIELCPPMFAIEPYAEIWHDYPSMESRIDIDHNWARFLGYFMGDGCWYKKVLSFSCDAKDTDVIEDVCRLVELITGRVPQTRQIGKMRGRKGCIEARLSIPAFQTILEHLGLLKVNGSGGRSRLIHVPACIMRSPKSIIRSFLQSLFECDGSSSNNSVRFASSSQLFIRQIQLLLLGFGINAQIYENVKLSGSAKPYVCYELSMGMANSIKFQQDIGFVSARKSTWRPLGKAVVERPMIDYVKSVEDEGHDDITYDLTILDNHTFSANGILTHNTADVAFVSSGDPAFTEQEIAYVRRSSCKPIMQGHWELVDGRPQLVPSKRGPLLCWGLPETGHKYYIGADAASGVEEGDFAAYAILDGTTGQMVGRFAERVFPEELARQLWMAGVFYNTAMINIELTGHLGRVVQRILRDDFRYWNLYAWKGKDDRMPGTATRRSAGWETTSFSRRLLFDNFRRCLRAGINGEMDGIELYDADLIEQMDLATLTEGMNWEVEKGHDDILFASMLAVITWIQYPPPRLMGRSRRDDPESLDDRQKMPIAVERGIDYSLGNHLKEVERLTKVGNRPGKLEGI